MFKVEKYAEEMTSWVFNEIPTIENYKFNDSLNRFYENKIRGLVKENIQNSLDAKLDNQSDPVVIIIEKGKILKSKLPGISALEPHINSLKGGNDYTNKTIKNIQRAINQNEVSFISFDDNNTKGLSVYPKGKTKSTWDAYAYNTGWHTKDENKEVEMKRGGSHGVGKIASNAASDIFLMYFANCDEFGNEHLGGTIQLIEHELDGYPSKKCYRSTGYYTKILSDGTRVASVNSQGGVFTKQSRGLKIIIPFLRDNYFETDDAELEIVRAVCDSFLLAILNGELIVYVNEYAINKDTIVDIIRNPYIYEIQNIDSVSDNFTPFYLQTYLEIEKREINIKSKEDSYIFDLYLKHFPESKKGRVSIFRTIGMKIEDFKGAGTAGFATKPFIGVLVGGLKEDQFLKELENEAHDRISSAHITDQSRQANGTRFINNLAKEIQRNIEEELARLNPTEGKLDTGDLLYIIENKFKEDLKKSYEKVEISNKNSIVKLADPTRQKRTRGVKIGTINPKATKIKRPGKEQGGSLDGITDSLEKFQLSPGVVNRLLLSDTEILRFDFTKLANIHSFSRFNLSMKIIDGEGNKSDEFIPSENFLEVIDQTNGQILQIKNDAIIDVNSIDNVANLRITLSPRYNRSLKFLYYVEV